MKENRWRLTARRLVVGAAMVVTVGAALAPSPVVERVVIRGTTTTRISLFDNHVAAVIVREGGELIFQRTFELGPETYVTYLGAIQRDRDAAKSNSGPPLASNTTSAELRIYLASGKVKTIRYTLTGVADLPLARLLATLDDLERFVINEAPEDESVQRWQPRRGDVIVFRNGRKARVTQVRPDGVIAVEYLDVAVIEMIPPDQRTRVINRIETTTP